MRNRLRLFWLAGVLVVAWGSVAFAAGTQTATINSTTFTDLGVAPVQVQTLTQPVTVVVADTIPTVGTAGTNLLPGQLVQFNPADASSHVWAAKLGATTVVNYSPVYATGGSAGGTVTANLGTLNGAATAVNQTAVQGPVAAGMVAGNSELTGCQYNSTVPSPTTGQQVATQCDADSNVRIVAGNTVSVCVTPTVTATNSYGVNYVVGGLLTFSNSFTAKGSGILQGVVANIKDVETSGFTFIPFASNPSNTTWTDAAVAAINAADKFTPRGPVALTANSQLGTQTINSAAGIGEALAPGTTSLYGVLIANAALTNQFAGTGDVQVCIKVLQDP